MPSAVVRPDSRAEARPSANKKAGTRQGSRSSATLSLAAPRPRAVQVAFAVLAAGFGASVGLSLTAETHGALAAPGGILMFLGNLTGMAGTYLALVMVLLVSRIPFVERVLGQDGLLRWHRKLSPWPISLIVLHAVLITFAYAEATKTGVLHQIGVFINSYAGMLAAVIGFGILVVIAVLSIHSVRKRMRRESWWALHLGMYLAFSLAFLHEIALGPSFVNHPLTIAVWSAEWAATAGLVIVYRFGLPLVRSLRHDLRVVQVQPEATGVSSIVLKGRRLDRLPIAGGQFAEWRFLARGMWWQAHPYSFSARPQPPYVRLTVKAVGDHSTAVSALKPGTRVAFEGPYGAFTAHALQRRKVALIAGGVGVTAIRSLLEDLPNGSEPAVVLRASTAEDVPLEAELKELVAKQKGKLFVLVGSRTEVPVQKVLNAITDPKRRDFYVAGPESFVQAVVHALERRGIPSENIHHEVYAL